MMYSPLAERAFPTLLQWLVTQSPLYPDVLEALVRRGTKPAGQVLELLQEYASKDDDQAVRNLFDLACRFSDPLLPKVVKTAVDLLAHRNPHIRECAADAIWRIGLPYGLPAKSRWNPFQKMTSGMSKKPRPGACKARRPMMKVERKRKRKRGWEQYCSAQGLPVFSDLSAAARRLI